ncbi:unnamed protein product [Cylindrotheca closterium]|uniref:TAFII55 protein conserved region domain-containing protein n=1 Tax=Cylindrotheca closterium TaxID=2856 RepID=A0AAD2GAE3_9STRA|nr:unnamed protein product [Cylindrotheca closterium]
MDRQPIRDRTLILRILVPGLETALRDKMKEVEEEAKDKPPAAKNKDGATILDLEGVACEPTKDASTLFNFICDGRTYPARLVNLPCPIELHKTHDHAMYYKSCDVAQMLIVYEDSMALDEGDAYKVEGFPSYYHSGLTPPMKRVVEKRFKKNERTLIPPPRLEVSDVEADLLEIMSKASKEGVKRNKVPSLASATHNKVLEEVVEEIVDFETWMTDGGGEVSGIEIESTDPIAIKHPELWLSPDKIEEINRKQRELDKEKERKKDVAQAKKEKKKKKKKDKEAPAGPSKKKGIASKKNEPPVDQIDQMAFNINLMNDDAALEGDLEFELDFDMNEDMDFGID